MVGFHDGRLEMVTSPRGGGSNYDVTIVVPDLFVTLGPVDVLRALLKVSSMCPLCNVIGSFRLFGWRGEPFEA